MDTTRVGAFRTMYLEEPSHLPQHAVEGTGLITGHGLYRVAVHGIARPDDGSPFPLHRAHQRRQTFLNVV